LCFACAMAPSPKVDFSISHLGEFVNWCRPAQLAKSSHVAIVTAFNRRHELRTIARRQRHH
jgi:hypothetical protein